MRVDQKRIVSKRPLGLCVPTLPVPESVLGHCINNIMRWIGNDQTAIPKKLHIY